MLMSLETNRNIHLSSSATRNIRLGWTFTLCVLVCCFSAAVAEKNSDIGTSVLTEHQRRRQRRRQQAQMTNSLLVNGSRSNRMMDGLDKQGRVLQEEVEDEEGENIMKHSEEMEDSDASDDGKMKMKKKKKKTKTTSGGMGMGMGMKKKKKDESKQEESQETMSPTPSCTPLENRYLLEFESENGKPKRRLMMKKKKKEKAAVGNDEVITSKKSDKSPKSQKDKLLMETFAPVSIKNNSGNLQHPS